MDSLIKERMNDSDMKEEEPPGVVLNDLLITKMDTNGDGSMIGGMDETKESESGGPELNKVPMNEHTKNKAKQVTRDSDIQEEETPGALLSGISITEMDTNGDGSKSNGVDDAAITISEKKESKNGGPELNQLPINERRRFLIQVRMILRLEFRDTFGVRFSNRCGHWLDRYMTHLVWKYGDWLDYPDGHHVLKGRRDSVCAVAVSTDGRFLFTAQFDGIIIVWDLLDYSMVEQFDTFDRAIRCLIYECDLLVFGSKDNKIRILNGITHQLIHTLEGHSGYPQSLRLNKKGNQLLSASADKTVKIWCIKTGNCLATLTGHTDCVLSADFMDSDTKIISGSLDDSMKVWSVDDQIELDTIMNGNQDRILGMCVNCDSSLVACYSGFKGMIIHNWPSMDILRTVQVRDIGQFHPCNPDILAVPDRYSNLVKIYNVRNGDRIAEFEGHSDEITGLWWSTDGSLLVSISFDHTVRVWNCTVCLKYN